MKYNLKQGDCNDLFKTIETESIDTILTDPPYGINWQSNRSKNGPRYKHINNDDKPNTEFLKEAYRVTKDGGALILFSDWKVSDEWKNAIEASGFKIKSQVIWNRLHHGMGDLKGAFAPMHDIIWYATKGRRIFTNGRPKSILEHKRPSPNEDYDHPTCKPVSLMVELIKATDDGLGGIILDPFMGTGSTGVATLEFDNKSFIGFELCENYYNTAKTRMSNEAKIKEIENV